MIKKNNLPKRPCLDRFVALLIDSLPIGIFVMIIYFIFTDAGTLFLTGFDKNISIESRADAKEEYNSLRNQMTIISGLIWFVYSAFMESSSYQGSFGKVLMKIKVVDLEGKKITFKKAFFRNALKFTSFLPGIGVLINFIIALTISLSKKKQGLHDMILKTLVVKRDGNNKEARSN